MPPLGLGRVGLKTNPFARRKLDPIGTPAHRALILDSVDGFRKLNHLDDVLCSAIEERHATFALVTGGTGAGRTTAANFLLARYRDLLVERWRAVDKQLASAPSASFLGRQFIVPNHDPISVFGGWFAALNADLKRKRWLDDRALADEVEKGPTLSDIRLTSDARYLAGRLHDELEPRARGFGVFLDDVPTFEIIKMAIDIFCEIPVLCVFTTLETDDQLSAVIRPFMKKAQDESSLVRVPLSPVRGGDVAEVVEHHWSKAAQWLGAPLANPFDPDVVARVFDAPRSIGKVLRVFATVLERRLEQFQPNDVLEFKDSDRLGEMVESIEGDLVGFMNG